MWLIPRDKSSPGDIAYRLKKRLEASRFTARVECDKLRNKAGVKIYDVRLKRYKSYCGQHPGPCQFNPFFQKPKRRGRWLEGLDWVGFNHLVNNLLDDLKSAYDFFSFNREADVTTHKYFLRHGVYRRVIYECEETFRFGSVVPVMFWTQGGPECFELHVGKPNPKIEDTTYPAGPGLPCYTLEDEDKLSAMPEYAKHH